MKIKGVTSIASAWPARIGWSPDSYQEFNELIPLTDVEIAYVRSGTRAGSFAVHGLAEYNSAAFCLAQVTAVLNHLDPEFGADASRKLNTIALRSRAEDLERVSAVLRGALLGDVQSLADLKIAITNAGSDYERETLANAQRLIELVPDTFHPTDGL